MPNPGDLLWTPSQERKAAAELTGFMGWLAERGQAFQDYDTLWQWSVTNIEDFWAAVWDYFDIGQYATAGYDQVLDTHVMPGAKWFSGARLNYAEVVLTQCSGQRTAIHAAGEDRPMRGLSWEELGSQTRLLATELRRLGIRPGDRVAAYLRNRYSPRHVPDKIIQA